MRYRLPMSYENYLFDLYGTLIDIKTDENAIEFWEKVAYWYAFHGASYRAKELETAYRALATEETRKLRETYHMDYPEPELRTVFWKLYLEKGVTVSEEEVEETARFFRICSLKRLKLYPGTLEMLRELKERGKKLYLLSNAQSCLTMPELKTLGLDNKFEEIRLSSDQMVKKPDRLFFSGMLEDNHLEPTKSLYIGNDSRADVAGAAQCGMDTFYVNSNLSPKGDKAPTATYENNRFTGWTCSGGENN